MATTTETKAAARMHDPAHPGEVLRALYLEPTSITVGQAAEALGYSRKHLSHFINGRASVTMDLAARLGVAFGTDADLWINLQAQFDIWTLSQQPKPKVKQLKVA